jgi:prepilin-type N-terminal cleavage/methylation domain-containing protein
MRNNLNFKIKKAFTLFEVVLALIIFSTLVGIIFSAYINIKKSE